VVIKEYALRAENVGAMDRKRKLILTVLVLGAVGSVVGFGAFSAFTATTANTGNTLSTGTVIIGQHAGATTLYTGTNKKPADSVVGCVRVTYTGSLTANVKLYASAGITNGTLFTLKIERGSGLSSPDNTMNCTGFSASSTPFNASIGTLGTSYGAGLDGKAGAATWATNDSIDYRFTISVNDDTTPNAHTSALSTGSHSFTWEAQNT
jgi:hypothetical protein